jgi:succinyl-diaminopimelate desuccinylase
MPDLAERLAARTLELVDIPSESHHEAAIAAHLATLVPPEAVVEATADEATLWTLPRRGRPLVVLAGHYDTVPIQGNVPGRLADGAVHGRGASDMKGGVAVAVELVRDLAPRADELAVDVGLLLFGREELPEQFNPLPALFDASRALAEAALVVLLEPTDGAIHVGCLGNLNLRVTFRGRAGHSARPWLADNAIERALEGLVGVAAVEPREVVIEGLAFYEAATITEFHAGLASNVVPDTAVATINVRYAPDRSPESAVEWALSLLPPTAEVEVTGNSPSGAVVAGTPLVRALQAAGGLDVQPKQAWTNVADFTARGIDAVNYGPGLTRYAHTVDEQVPVESLVRCYETLRRFLETGARDAPG